MEKRQIGIWETSMRQTAFVVLWGVLILSGCDRSTPEEKAPDPPSGQTSPDVVSIHIGTPSGWLLEIRPDGSGQVILGSPSRDFAPVPAHTFDFPTLREKLGEICVSKGNRRAHFMARLQGPDFFVQTQYFTDSDLADSLVGKALDALDAAGEHAVAQTHARLKEFYRSEPPGWRDTGFVASSGQYETAEGQFDYDSRSPLEFLEYLKLKQQEQPDNTFACVRVLGVPSSWIDESHLAELADVLDSEESCASTVSLFSSIWPMAPSTVGQEAAFLMEGFRKGRYSPAQLSSSIDIADVKAWWSERNQP